MPQLYTRSSKQRVPLLPIPARLTRSRVITKHNLDFDTSKGHLEKGTGDSPKSDRLRPHKTDGTRQSKASEDGDDSSLGEEDNDESSGEDDDSESEDKEPAVYAPFQGTTVFGTGRQVLDHTSHLFLEGQDNNLIDSDDDDYQGVDEISDFDDELNDDVLETLELENIMFSEAEADPSNILDELDTMSVLGFANDIAGLSESADSASDPAVERHVHFVSENDHPRLFSQSLSPLLTRALLPSALPESPAHDSGITASLMAKQGLPWAGRHRRLHSVEELPIEELDDSDATDEYLPAEAHTTPKALHKAAEEVDVSENFPSTRQKSGKKPSMRSRGPKRGTFIVDKDKPWAILDSTGRKMVFLPAPDTKRHEWLDQKVQQAYNASANSSPATSFVQLIDEASITSSQDNQETLMATADANVMIAGLSSGENVGIESNNGHATAPAEAFYPPAGYVVAGDYVIGVGDLEEDIKSEDSNEGDLPVKLDDLISWDDSSELDEDSPNTPAIYMPPLSELSGSGNINEQFSHLNNTNVTAFRRNADPARAASRRLSELSGFAVSHANLSTPTQSHKRKRSNPPYHGKRYEGVTPVQRRIIQTPKRRKLTI